ncbi:MAG: NADPH-dependent assimilatory sulfite reductase hemoprotein subunit [Candidatus Sumerlaeia bacterium]
MARKSVEEIKGESRGLRGRLAQDLADHNKPAFDEEEAQLLKFHGAYQQDNRDTRLERRKQKLDKEWIYMVRTKCPGGDLTAAQYLALDRLVDELGWGALRITSREGLQLHGVSKMNLKQVIRRINEAGVTTRGACGDVVRNTMAPSAPLADAVHRDAQALARRISEAFLWKSTAYVEIWCNGEKADVPEWNDARADAAEPLYGRFYLPRKFKFAIAVPPRNDVDVYANDVGIVPHFPNGEVEGYTILVGGGMGMAHGVQETHPALAQPLFYVRKQDIMAAATAIVQVQRDHGRRDDRRQARLKYLIRDRGLQWFREQVLERLPDVSVEPPRPLHWETVGDLLGWHEQGDGRLFVGIYVQDGRIKDEAGGGPRWKSALRRIAESFGFPIRLTANTNILFYNIAPEQRDAVDAVLREHGLAGPEALTLARRMSQACVALPTCGLALTESERVFAGIMDQLDRVLRELGLEREPILVRMTGCPNGCARPYNADIAFVGRAPGQYAVFAGGHHAGTRLVRLQHKQVALEELVATVRPWLEDFARNRLEGESFSEFWGRTRLAGAGATAPPDPSEFHVEAAAAVADPAPRD